jgi:hypothetical protein
MVNTYRFFHAAALGGVNENVVEEKSYESITERENRDTEEGERTKQSSLSRVCGEQCVDVRGRGMG